MNVGEMFAGIGGFRLGLERAGHRIVWANELDKHACQVYRKNFGEKELIEGDIRKVNTNDIPDIDLIVGGFPCQPHSLAGKRKGFSDERGEVFHQIIRIARAKRPKMLLLENVKGLLSSEQGRAFGTVLEELGNIGYWCEWQVINSKYHGVPQNRERVFIIGHLRGTSSKQIFPIIEGNGFSQAESSGQCRKGAGIWSRNSPTIRATYHKGYETRGPLISPTIDARYGALRNSGEPYIMQIKRHMMKIEVDQQLRRLTEVECERLQGFPDGWTEGISGTQRYKCLGNAVTVNVIQAIGELILEALD